MDTDGQNLTSSCYAEFVLATCKSAELGEWYTTTGGFMSFLHNQPNISQHYNFVAASSHYTPLHANSSSPPLANGGSSVLLATPTPPPLTGNQDNVNVDSDDDNGVVRIKLKLNWIQVEDVRLMSAWLNNSMDPINGNDKKAENIGEMLLQNTIRPHHRIDEEAQSKPRSVGTNSKLRWICWLLIEG